MQDVLSAGLKDGLGQSERLLRQLIPENTAIDDRDMAALLQLTVRLSKEINYYNAENRIEGDWEGFFVSDSHILTTLISGMDFSGYRKKYESAGSSTYFSEDDAALQHNSRLLFRVLYNLADDLDALLEKAGGAGMPDDIKNKIAGIKEKSAAIRPELEAYDNEVQSFFDAGSNSRESVLRILPAIHTTFSDLLIQCNRLRAVSDYYRQNNDRQAPHYAPHLGLFIAFLHLYGYLQGEINQLTKKHLDFYYRDVLGMGSGAEVPDKVHLLFAAEPHVEQVLLRAGEEMPAEIPGWEKPLTYRMLTDMNITKTRVEALETIFISDKPVFTGREAEHHSPRNAQVYKSQCPCLSPDLLLKGNLPPSWPLFGEDQDELPRDKRSMNDAEIGLLLASPVFYLTGGMRRLQLSFYLDAGSFQVLNDYIDQFAKASRKTAQAVQNELLTHAFTIDFTAAEGWAPADKYTVRIREENCLEIIVELKSASKPFVGYRPGIHGPDYDTVLPVLRLLINHHSSHNAYSFLRGLVIERLHLKSEVKNFRQVKMQNSMGNLAPFNAFQPFGPQPAVGSNLDIRNSNVFNRYTTDIGLRLEWMDLPKEPGGFATYYEGYGTGVNDASFRVGISALTDGVCKPAAALQQTFPLFAGNGDDGESGLAMMTRIDGIDLKKLELSNRPLLAQEENEPDGFFRSGAIRLELLSPPDAFGHALFPKIFPDIALHNARLWNKKRPLPNQPFTPRVKSVTVNYTLEHAEAFKDVREPGSEDRSFELIHQYPSGYRKIYPGNELRSMLFLPSFGYRGNLYIGLRYVQAGEELSLLFQLEEKNFHHTLHETDKVIWNYLQEDDWLEMDEKSVLSDTTHGFISTGIVRLKMPGTISLQHRIRPAGLFWIRASIAGLFDMKSRVIAIVAQAAPAGRAPDQVMDVLKADGFYLPSGVIKGFARKVAGVQQVWQPFLSFDGRPAEKDESFYARVSERLRHKKRPLTSMDISQLVLEKFPSIAMVKCFGTGYKRQPVYPGVDIQVILIPREEGTDGSLYSDQPKVNLATLFAVKNFLAGFSSPFINIEIGNPVYEKIKIACRIKLAHGPGGNAWIAGEGSGYYLKRLHEDIRQYLCPWRYSPGSTIKIGTRVYIPEILTYIKRRPYIIEVSGFSVVHFFNVKDVNTGQLRAAVIDSAVTPVEFIQGSVPEAVLIPSEHHLISLMEEGEADYADPLRKGIGDFYIGEELLVPSAMQQGMEGYDETPFSSEDPEEYFNWTIDNL